MTDRIDELAKAIHNALREDEQGQGSPYQTGRAIMCPGGEWEDLFVSHGDEITDNICIMHARRCRISARTAIEYFETQDGKP